MDKEFCNTPKVIVFGKVCHPGWLFEIECVAITNKEHLMFWLH